MRTRIIAVSIAAVAACLLAGLLTDPVAGDENEAKAAEALKAAVAEGNRLFRDPTLGTSGKSCAICHEDPERPKLALAARAGGYPKWDRRADAVITLGQKIRQMIETNLKGTSPALGTASLVAIEAFLMSIASPR
jgi:mono/diheme cytochrome c family protein